MVDKAREGGRVNNEGYVNVGLQLGMSRVRGKESHLLLLRSTYHILI